MGSSFGPLIPHNTFYPPAIRVRRGYESSHSSLRISFSFAAMHWQKALALELPDVTLSALHELDSWTSYVHAFVILGSSPCTLSLIPMFNDHTVDDLFLHSLFLPFLQVTLTIRTGPSFPPLLHSWRNVIFTARIDLHSLQQRTLAHGCQLGMVVWHDEVENS